MGTDSDTKEVYSRAFSVGKCKRTYFSMSKRKDNDTWIEKQNSYSAVACCSRPLDGIILPPLVPSPVSS